MRVRLMLLMFSYQLVRGLSKLPDRFVNVCSIFRQSFGLFLKSSRKVTFAADANRVCMCCVFYISLFGMLSPRVGNGRDLNMLPSGIYGLLHSKITRTAAACS